MDRFMCSFTSPTSCVPHARGDGPHLRKHLPRTSVCSPRTWGWTVNGTNESSGTSVFPTHVGMDRLGGRFDYADMGVPHARGDGPDSRGGHRIARWCSPRTWGWTVLRLCYRLPGGVFPTHVGMDRLIGILAQISRCVPHARGDGPRGRPMDSDQRGCSPRTWGWTAGEAAAIMASPVFPTHVGMDRC